MNVTIQGASDNTIRRYAEEIWGVKPVPIELEEDKATAIRGRATGELPTVSV